MFGDLADGQGRARAVARLLETRGIQRLGLPLESLRHHWLGTATSYPAFLEELLRFSARANGKGLYGEKTPQHALVATQLLGWFPNSRMIHIVRDPRDVVASLKRMPWGLGAPFLDARLWCACVEGAQACANDPRFILVRYETLIERPEGELTRLCQCLGVEFVAAMLVPDNKKTDRWWFDRAQRQLETSRVGRWRQDLSPVDVAVVEATARPWMASFDYSADEPAASPSMIRYAKRQAAWATLRRKVRHLPASYWRLVHPDRLAREERAADGTA